MGNLKSQIKFIYNTKRFFFPGRIKTKSFIFFLFQSEKKKIGQIRFIFTSDKLLLELNRKFLKRHYKTDILTFPLSLIPVIDAEIYISIERIHANALHFQTDFKNEFLRVLFHGALHLCGYNDDTPKDQMIMRQREDHYLKLFKSFT